MKVGIPSGVGRLPHRAVVVEGVPYSDFSLFMLEVLGYWRGLNFRSDNDFTILFLHLWKLIFKDVQQDLQIRIVDSSYGVACFDRSKDGQFSSDSRFFSSYPECIQ